MVHAAVYSASAVFGLGIGQILRREGFTVSMLPALDAEHLRGPARLLVIAPDAGRTTAAAELIDRIALATPVIVVTSELPPPTDPEHLSPTRRLVHHDATVETWQQLVRAAARGEPFPPRPAPAPAAGEAAVLSRRESQVLRQIASGLTHYQVARRLGISQHTVDTYVSRIRSKLNIGNKADLTRAALRLFDSQAPAP